MKFKLSTILLAIAILLAAVFVFWLATSPDSVGGSFSSYEVGPSGKLIVVSQKDWDTKGKVVHIGGHAYRVKFRSQRVAPMATSGPCYRVEGEVHGDAKLIDKVVQGLGHFKVCMQANDHTKILDAYTNASASHRETWMWQFQWLDTTKGAGVSTKWCLSPGEVGPCQAVEYRYWRFTFQWMQGVNVFGQTIGLHHKTLYIGCTLRAGTGGFQCGTGEA